MLNCMRIKNVREMITEWAKQTLCCNCFPFSPSLPSPPSSLSLPNFHIHIPPNFLPPFQTAAQFHSILLNIIYITSTLFSIPNPKHTVQFISICNLLHNWSYMYIYLNVLTNFLSQNRHCRPDFICSIYLIIDIIKDTFVQIIIKVHRTERIATEC